MNYDEIMNEKLFYSRNMYIKTFKEKYFFNHDNRVVDITTTTEPAVRLFSSTWFEESTKWFTPNIGLHLFDGENVRMQHMKTNNIITIKVLRLYIPLILESESLADIYAMIEL